MKKARILSIILTAVMLLSLIPAMTFATSAAAPTTLPDLSGAGIPLVGYHYANNDSAADMAVFTHYPAVSSGCNVNSDVHAWGDNALGNLTNAASENGSVLLPTATQGQSFKTVNLFSGSMTVTTGRAANGQTLATDLNTVIPEDAVGFLFAIETTESSTAAIRINPVFEELKNENKNLRTVKGNGSYVYFYDEAQNAWGATPTEHAYRVPGGAIQYIYIPFETWQITANANYYSAYYNDHLTTAEATGMKLTNIEFSWDWGMSSMVVKSVDIVRIDTSDSDEWDGTADTSWFDPDNMKDSYELDTAEKVAGLAKIVSDSGKANYPYCDNNEKLINFYITKNIDLKGQEWLPIGETYAKRFGGNIIGKLGGVEGAAVTVKNMKITRAADENTGFIGSIDGVPKGTGAQVKNLCFENASIVTEADTAMAIVVGYARSGGVYENIHVYNSTLKSTDGTASLSYIGGIVGYSKYGTNITLRDCSFDGNLVVTGGSGVVGGIIGEATMGAMITGCYVGGQIVTGSACAVVGGLLANAGGETIVIADSQMDANMRAEAAGSLIGAVVGNAPKLTANRVLYTGVAVQATIEGSAILPWMGTASTDAVTMADCYSMIKAAPVGSKATLGSTTQKGVADLMGDTAKTTLANFDFAADWSARDGMYPVLTSVVTTASTSYANMDLSWYDPTQTEMSIGTLAELVGFSRVSQLDNFSGKTVNLTSDIDGTNKLADQALELGTNQEGILVCPFLGTFDTGNFVIRNIDFSGVDGFETYIVTWIIGENSYEERYKYGEVPTCKQETVRPNDEKFSYEFKNWAPVIEPVTKDVTYEAIWRSTKLETETEEVTEPVTDAATTPVPDQNTTDTSSGCKSVAGLSALALVVIAGLAVDFKRKK